MNIRFNNPIIFSGDIERSKAFYHGLLGLAVIQDSGSFVLLEGNLGLHSADVFYEYLKKPYRGESMGRDNLDLYFTATGLEEVQQRLKEAGVPFIHGIQRCPWGETVLRVYDPDGHIVEIGDAGQGT
jgi:Glyoxalase/Bleomycin resistance protein/Dioxygenase superfamily.